MTAAGALLQEPHDHPCQAGEAGARLTEERAFGKVQMKPPVCQRRAPGHTADMEGMHECYAPVAAPCTGMTSACTL